MLTSNGSVCPSLIDFFKSFSRNACLDASNEFTQVVSSCKFNKRNLKLLPHWYNSFEGTEQQQYWLHTLLISVTLIKFAIFFTKICFFTRNKKSYCEHLTVKSSLSSLYIILSKISYTRTLLTSVFFHSQQKVHYLKKAIVFFYIIFTIPECSISAQKNPFQCVPWNLSTIK